MTLSLTILGAAVQTSALALTNAQGGFEHPMDNNLAKTIIGTTCLTITLMFVLREDLKQIFIHRTYRKPINLVLLMMLAGLIAHNIFLIWMELSN